MPLFTHPIDLRHVSALGRQLVVGRVQHGLREIADGHENVDKLQGIKFSFLYGEYLIFPYVLLNIGVDETGHQLLDQVDASVAQRSLLLLGGVRPHSPEHVDAHGLLGDGDGRAERSEAEDDNMAAHFLQLVLDLTSTEYRIEFPYQSEILHPD